MKMKKTTLLLLCAISILTGFFLAVQIQTPGKSMKLYVGSKALVDMKAKVAGELQNGENLRQRIEETKQRIEETKILMEDDQSEELLASNAVIAEYYKTISGMTDLVGPGVEVVIDDSNRDLTIWEDVNDVIVHDSDVLLILNDLLAAGAEAISLNGHRIVHTSAVSCGGYIVHVNGVPEAKPFRIQAIGDPAVLSAAMLAPNSYGSFIKDSVKFQVTALDEVFIPAYSDGDLTRHSYVTVSKEAEGKGETL
ncbi:MAG: DUF881 domain-containing protein [Firmicutes bacterium]|nr:DUF881 domain-containing protein [Bacillota bacterium]